MFIDIHAHVSRAPHERAQWLPYPEQLARVFVQTGVERAAVLPLVSPEGALRDVQSNAEILDIARDYPLFIPFCNVDPRFRTAALTDTLKYYRDQGCQGVGEVTANLPFLDSRVQALFKAAEATALPLTFHMAAKLGDGYGLYDDPGMPQLEESLARFPGLIFIGHSQAFWSEMAVLENIFDRSINPRYPVRKEGRVLFLMRNHPNLYGDLSAGSGYNALARDRAYAAKFMEEFQGRLLFGQDICNPQFRAPLRALLLEMRAAGEISAAVFNKIARENAIRLLNLRTT